MANMYPLFWCLRILDHKEHVDSFFPKLQSNVQAQIACLLKCW